MSDTEATHAAREETAVDDVRRVREQFHRQSGGDIRKHVEESNRVLEEYREKLNLKVVAAPPAKGRRDGTRG